jgi:esterase/lipase superfamily enzyme
MRGRMKKQYGLGGVLALCAALLLGGCTLSNSLRPEPVNSVWHNDAAVTRSLFFATDREPVAGSFGLHWGATLRCGRTEVSIPAIAMPGQNPPANGADCDNPASLAVFARQIRETARTMNCTSVLLVIHGYNATFATGLLRAGQIALDTQWRCAVLMFSWSSEGKFDRYAADIERSGYAVPALIALLREMNMAGLTVNVVAHSMGARIVLGAAGALCQERRSVVDQMILSASDVSAEHDNDDFGHLLKRAGGCTQRTTLYSSENDMALITSESFHGGVPRAGRGPLPNLRYAAGYGAVDVVDASQAPGDSAGHSYFTRSYEMLRDMMWALAGTPAAQRAAPDGPAGQTLNCRDWEGSMCGAGGGRYVLAVAPDREPDRRLRLARRLWSLIFPVQ